MQDSVTAITFVALGTSLPDLFASKQAATMDDTADNSIGNVTGSNSVNVFLGLGLPWLIAAIYWESRYCIYASSTSAPDTSTVTDRVSGKRLHWMRCVALRYVACCGVRQRRHNVPHDAATQRIHLNEPKCNVFGRVRPSVCLSVCFPMQIGSPNLTRKCATVSPGNTFTSGSKGQRSTLRGIRNSAGVGCCTLVSAGVF